MGWQYIGGEFEVEGHATPPTAALAAMRLLRSLLYGVCERDTWAYGGAIAVAIVTTFLACWLPASRASRTEPAVALREEG